MGWVHREASFAPYQAALCNENQVAGQLLATKCEPSNYVGVQCLRSESLPPPMALS